jgi:segregation and condensation protein B
MENPVIILVPGLERLLLKKGLIRIVGRKPLPGGPIICGTTEKFLEVFDLKDLSSLPTLREIEELGDEEDSQ